MSSLPSLNQAIQNLVNSSPTVPNTLDNEVVNIYPEMRPLFNDKAGKALHNKVHNLINQRTEVTGHVGLAELLSKLRIKKATHALQNGIIGERRVLDMVLFLGITCYEDEIYLGVDKVATAINDLAEKGYVTGALMPLSIMKLVSPQSMKIDHLVLSYIAVTSTGQKYLEATYPGLLFTEGGIPKRVGEQ